MQPRKPLSREEALSLAADALREAGFDQEATWIENAQHVRALLSADHVQDGDDGLACEGCHSYSYESHNLDCSFVAAWRVLGDPRGREDIGLAEDIARRHHAELEYEHTRCKASGDGRCRLVEGHEGEHAWVKPINMAGVNAALKALYPPERIESIVFQDNALLNLVRR